MKSSHDIHAFVWNMSEDIWPFLSSVTTRSLREYETVENDLYADREFFGFPSRNVSLYFTPQPVSKTFLLHVASVVGNHDVSVFTPKGNTSALSLDICRDETIISSLIRPIKPSQRLILTGYSSTPQFLELAEYLRRKGVTVLTPESPNKNGEWTSEYFGSKSGIRQVLSQSLVSKKLCKLAEGYIAHSIEEAASLAAWIYGRSEGVVLKTNKAHSGSGVLIFRNSTLPREYDACRKKILSILTIDEYWRRFPIVVEACILLNDEVLGGNPSIEFCIDSKGIPQYLYTCGMRVDDAGAFGGVEIGNIALDAKLESTLKTCGIVLGNVYASAGYRGYFDVDCLYDVHDDLYVAESNVRRTGGTYVYTFATDVFGKRGYKKKYIASTTYQFASKAQNLSTTIQKLGDCAYSSQTLEGILVTSENLLTVGKLMYIVIANTKEHAFSLEQRMQERL